MPSRELLVICFICNALFAPPTKVFTFIAF
jgi:hypothetical protein